MALRIYHIRQPQPRQGRRTKATLCGAKPTEHDNSFSLGYHDVVGQFVPCEQCLAKRAEVKAR